MWKSGTLLAIREPSPEVARMIESELTYNHVRFIRGQQAKWAGTNVQITPMKCYEYVDDPDGILPTHLYFPAGYLNRVATRLKAGGCRLLLHCPKAQARMEPQWDRLKPAPVFRYKQRHVLERMAQSDGGQIICPTGYGKGFLIGCFCQMFPKARIDISTASLDVLEQLYWDIKQRIPGITIDSSKMRRIGTGRINLYSGKSLHHADGQADFLLIDEGHEWGTADYIERISRYTHARRFMFTATPERADNAHFELEGAFGPPLVVITHEEAVQHGCIVPTIVRMNDVIMDVDPSAGYDDTAKERWGIWRNRVRNEIIAERARTYDDDTQVLISVKTTEHAMFLKKRLPEFSLCYSEQGLDPADFQRYIGWGLISKDEPMMTRQKRREMRDAFKNRELKKVIATSVWSRGVDFKDLAVLIRADASDSKTADKQWPGRTCRLPDQTNKQFAVVEDFLDQFNKGFARKGSNRKRHYVDAGFEVIMPERLRRVQQAQGMLF